MAGDDQRPEWVPPGADPLAFTTRLIRGVGEGEAPEPPPRPGPGRPPADPEWIVEGILAGERMRLARGITLIESRAAAHLEAGREVLRRCLPHSGRSRRIGITGVPGAGKSTLIESFGLRLCEKGHRLAVLAVDPSSSRSGGSILGDKTRMERLSRHPSCFIRPSPSSGTLGGVAARTREAMILVEAAGYDTVFVETVGVGQSEVAVRSMVDFFLLLQIAGGGDDLQGIKKGVIEICDAIAVNKADGDNLTRARRARAEYARILQYIDPYSAGWEPRALAISAATGDGFDELETMLADFLDAREAGGLVSAERRRQNAMWFDSLLREAILLRALSDPGLAGRLAGLRRSVEAGDLPVGEAVERALGEG